VREIDRLELPACQSKYAPYGNHVDKIAQPDTPTDSMIIICTTAGCGTELFLIRADKEDAPVFEASTLQ
jgi:hypothetical protein